MRIAQPVTQIIRLKPYNNQLRKVLVTDMPGVAYRGVRRAYQREIRLISKTLSVLDTFSPVHIAIAEAVANEGAGIQKVLWGWREEAGAEALDLGSCDIEYVLAVQHEADSPWQLLKKPRLTFTSNLHELVNRGLELGNRILEHKWEIKNSSSGLGHVAFGSRTIHGFDKSYGHVYSLIRQEGDSIVARFYLSLEKARRNTGLMKIAVLSRRVQALSGGQGFVPLDQPEVTFSLVRQQKQRIETARIERFLSAEAQAGRSLDLTARPVIGGQVRIKINGQLICLTGFHEQEGVRLFGRIVVEEQAKRVYFWTNGQRRGSPLNPEGRVLAQKEAKGKRWEIVWRAASEEWHALKNSALVYGNYLFASVGKKTFSEHWRVYRSEGKGGRRSEAKKTIRGSVFQLWVPQRIKSEYIFSETREYGGRLKIVSFWADAKSHGLGRAPFAHRFISFKPDNSRWEAFWSRLNNWKAIESLAKQGKINLPDLEAAITEMSADHFKAACRAIDALFINDTRRLAWQRIEHKGRQRNNSATD